MRACVGVCVCMYVCVCLRVVTVRACCDSSEFRWMLSLCLLVLIIHLQTRQIIIILTLILTSCVLFQPEWKLADPICTFLFSILVLVTTITILKDIIVVLMEGKT